MLLEVQRDERFVILWNELEAKRRLAAGPEGMQAIAEGLPALRTLTIGGWDLGGHGCWFSQSKSSLKSQPPPFFFVFLVVSFA